MKSECCFVGAIRFLCNVDSDFVGALAVFPRLSVLNLRHSHLEMAR
jgi:hypothetical protein